MARVLLTFLILATLLAAVLLVPVVADSPAAPGSEFSRLDAQTTSQLIEYMKSRDTIDALVIASSEQVMLEAGVTHLPINTHSVRKSLMNVMIGAAVAQDELDIDVSLAELGIDDQIMPLSDTERSARVLHLLQARSGIYIESAGETATMKALRPQRGQYEPGEHYYYNNWDFNVLGRVLEQATGRPLEDHFAVLAQRLAFRDYHPSHLRFSSTSGSEHEQYVIYLSARDLAGVGQMMLNLGRAADDSVLITPEWVALSTAHHSDLIDREPLDGYGLLWSVDSQSGTFWATGWGGQYLLVDPANDLLIVTRNDTGRRLGAVLWLSVLGNSTQGRMHEVMALRELYLADRLMDPGA